MPAPAAAVDQQITWKHPEMQGFAVALVRAAYARAMEGIHKFTTDIVPDTVRGDGHGIAGSVVTLLKNAHVIEPVGIFSGGKFFALRERSNRAGRKDAWNNVYRLCSLGVAREFLQRNGAPVAARQEELTFG